MQIEVTVRKPFLIIFVYFEVEWWYGFLVGIYTYVVNSGKI